MVQPRTQVLSARQPRRTLGRKFIDWAERFEDGAILRSAFWGMLIGTIGVLYIDYGELAATEPPPVLGPSVPVLPAADPALPGVSPGPEVTTDYATLQAPLSAELQPGNVLALTGTIDAGAAERVRAELQARGEYVKSVALDSPGGSVADALAIGDLLRKGGYVTEVKAGALCASSCPLVFAAGVERTASRGAAIGVHQIYATVATSQLDAGMRQAGYAMSEAQKTTATITRYLTGMGVDPALWLHALETPPTQLYYLAPDEMLSLKLTTALAE